MTASKLPVPSGSVAGQHTTVTRASGAGLSTTICAPATAPGGALAIIRISGPDAITIADRIFHGRAPLAEAHTHTTHFGTIQPPCSTIPPQAHHPSVPIIDQHPTLLDAPNPVIDSQRPVLGGNVAEPIDEALATIFRTPHSYTGEDSVELSLHGSPYIIQQVLSLLCANGCRMAEPGEFTRRAFLNGRLDLSQAEAVADLIASETAGQHRIALSQLRGGISSRLAQLRDKLLHLTSLLELELDFSDHEDLEFADRTQLLAVATEAEEHIARLAATFQQGQAIRQGIPVAIVGKTNVGKSTLLNALLSDNRAIVSDIHGTTRDTIEETFIIRDLQFRLIDTAGLRTTTDQVEQIGITRTLQKIREAAIIIHLVDNPADLNEPPVSSISSPTLPSQCPAISSQIVIPVLNKIDLQEPPITTSLSPASRDSSAVPSSQHPVLGGNVAESFLPISAKQGTNLPLLTDRLYALGQQLTSTVSDVIITNARHHEALLAALADLRRALAAMRTGIPADLVAEDLRSCIAHCNTILGTSITPQDTLNTIFSHFCVGK